MPSGLSSPRSRPPGFADLGERSAFVAGQRVGRARRRRRRRPSGRLLRAAGGLLLVAGGLVALGAGARWLLTTPRFAVAGVEVRGASRVPAEQILAAAGIEPGASIFRVDTGGVVGRVEALPEIRRADLVRELPNRVVITVEERRPFTLVEPVQAPGPKARAAIALIRALLRSGSGLTAEISEIDMSRRDGPVLYTVDGVEVRLGAEEWEERLARLEGVLAQVATQDVRAVDLRFRDQVVLQRGGAR